jgi:uncharacterized protein
MTQPPEQPVPKPFRPRDEYGRPLRPGDQDRLALPNFDAMTLDEAHEAAIRYFDAGNYFAAHEAWETCWGLVKGTDVEEFFKGLAQLGAGYTHWMRCNPHGAVALLGRALERMTSRGPRYRGIDIEAFAREVAEVREQARAAEASGSALPVLERRAVPKA